MRTGVSQSMKSTPPYDVIAMTGIRGTPESPYSRGGGGSTGFSYSLLGSESLVSPNCSVASPDMILRMKGNSDGDEGIKSQP
jgi:hypothetical protein